VKVRDDEGVAIRIGPEPCVGVRKDVNEASVGEGAKAIEPRNPNFRVPTLFRKRKATRPSTLSRALG
jgi:hypothetical protein